MSEEHDPTTDEQPAMPAWVPRSSGPTEDGPDEPAEIAEPAEAAAEAETLPPPPGAPIDDSATRSFPPLGSVNPHPGAAPTPPAAPTEPSPSWAPPADPAPPSTGSTPPGAPVAPPGPAPAEPPAQTAPPAAAPPASAPPASSHPPAVPPSSGPPAAASPVAPTPAQPVATPPPSAPAPAPPAASRPPQAGPPPAIPAQQPPGPGPAAPYGAPPQASATGQPYGQGAAYPSGYANPPTLPPAGQPPATSSGGGRRTLLTVLGTLLAVGLIGGVAAILLNGGDDGTETAAGDPDDDDADSTTDPDAADQTDDTTTDGVDAEPPGAEVLARSVVQIQLLLEGEPVCTGSGTIVDTVGTILTNFHVVEQSPLCPHDQIAVAVAESSQSVPDVAFVADLLVSDPALDLAVIRVRETIDGSPLPTEFEPIEIGDSDGVELGDEIRIIGFPGIGGETVTFTTGSVSGFAETPEGGERSWLKTDATIAGGNSGGLAADTDGRFVGIPTRAGSGSGQIVDCRVIADSNGDGRLSEDDSCVPIGGFINGVRPLSLALPLIEQAETATAIDQGPPSRSDPMNPILPIAFSPTWTNAVDEDGVATDDLVTTVPGGSELCLTWAYDDVPQGAVIEGIWLLDGELVEEAAVAPSTNDGPTDGEAWACITATDGLPAGVFEFAWFIDDELVFGEGFVIGDGEVAEVVVSNESDMPLCVIQYNPSGTSTWGLNELSRALEPGETFTMRVAVGATDVRVIDCNRDIHIEDASGFVIDEDITLTID